MVPGLSLALRFTGKSLTQHLMISQTTTVNKNKRHDYNKNPRFSITEFGVQSVTVVGFQSAEKSLWISLSASSDCQTMTTMCSQLE